MAFNEGSQEEPGKQQTCNAQTNYVARTAVSNYANKKTC